MNMIGLGNVHYGFPLLQISPILDQNMVKHPLGIYHSISTLYADLMMNSVTLCVSYGKFPRDA